MDAFNPLDDVAYTARSVAYTGTAGVTGTWSPGADAVLVWATTDCFVKVGEGAVATSASTPIPAYTPIRIRVPLATSGGGPWRVSAIQVSASGTVFAKPCLAQ